MRVLIMFSLFLLPLSAWAGHPMEPVMETWTGSPMPQGGTYYSNGLDTVEVYRNSPSSSTYFGWDRDGREMTGTIYTQPRYDQPKESLHDWAERMLQPASRDGARGPRTPR